MESSFTRSTVHLPGTVSPDGGRCHDPVPQIEGCASVRLFRRLSRRWAMLLLCLSKRVKSIYYLRLFNESVLMLPLYLSILLFTYQQWFWGIVVLSFALSIKMNVLLFFPGLLLLLFEVALAPPPHC